MSTLLEVNSMYIPSLEPSSSCMVSNEFDYEGFVEIMLHNEKLGTRIFPEHGNWETWAVKKKVNINLYLNLQGDIKTCKYKAEKTTFVKISRWIYQVQGRIIGSEESEYYLLGFPEIELDNEIIDYYHSMPNKNLSILFTGGIWGDDN